MSHPEHLQPVSRRALAHQGLRLMGVGALLGWTRGAHASTTSAPPDETTCWLNGQALQVFAPEAMEFIRPDAHTAGLHLRGRSYSHNSLVVSVSKPASAHPTSGLHRLAWRCNAQAGAHLQGLQVWDGDRVLAQLDASELQAQSISFAPTLRVKKHLQLRWDLEFADTQRELIWHDLCCEFV